MCNVLIHSASDDNDVDSLPAELGSCRSLRILSARANNLTTLPAEMDHIEGLSVVNLTGNRIRHLPVSFMKLRGEGRDHSISTYT